MCLLRQNHAVARMSCRRPGNDPGCSHALEPSMKDPSAFRSYARLPGRSSEYFQESSLIVDGSLRFFRRSTAVLDPRDISPSDFQVTRRSLGAHDLSIRRLLSAVVGRGIHDPVVWGRDFQVPRRLRDAIRNPLPRLTWSNRSPRAIDGFQKLLFRTHDGLAVESVLIPLHKPGAVSVCLSSQVGCPMGCVFCATARMPRRRNLETWEIIDQFVQARDARAIAGAAGHGRGFHGDGRTAPAGCQTACDGRGLVVVVPLWRPARREGDHDQHRRHRPPDRRIHGRGTQVPALDQPRGRDRREAAATGPGRGGLVGCRGDGRGSPPCAWRGETG